LQLMQRTQYPLGVRTVFSCAFSFSNKKNQDKLKVLNNLQHISKE
jgi:hypothetical protein